MSAAATIIFATRRPGILVTVPYHNRDLKRGTLAAILHQAMRTPDQLRELL
jgi:predicted RNA binding protein YcfA (HicA-like mRNA interferase family)